jgi:uncharacterized membrane protein YphA (DoxX/SURF4 family)
VVTELQAGSYCFMDVDYAKTLDGAGGFVSQFRHSLFVLGTALIAHTFWNVEGAMQTANMVQFYKNLSIMGGLFLLAVTGAGKYAVQKS